MSLREDFMPDYDLTVSGLASALGVLRQSVNGPIRERRAVSPEMALRLAKLFGNPPEFWLNLQRSIDLWDAEAAIEDDVQRTSRPASPDVTPAEALHVRRKRERETHLEHDPDFRLPDGSQTHSRVERTALQG
jgi:addiction module HigA family antidote